MSSSEDNHEDSDGDYDHPYRSGAQSHEERLFGVFYDGDSGVETQRRSSAKRKKDGDSDRGIRPISFVAAPSVAKKYAPDKPQASSKNSEDIRIRAAERTAKIEARRKPVEKPDWEAHTKVSEHYQLAATNHLKPASITCVCFGQNRDSE